MQIELVEEAAPSRIVLIRNHGAEQATNDGVLGAREARWYQSGYWKVQ